MVYSATETRHVGKFTDYFPHTAYFIYQTNGNVLRWVQNAVGNIDETPTLVRLPAGIYSVVAEDDDYGRITIPVLIGGGETTTVHLDGGRLPPDGTGNAVDTVRLPNGRIVGWKANAMLP